MEFSLEALGMTTECFADRVVNAIAEKVLNFTDTDEDGRESYYHSHIQKRLERLIEKRIDEAISAIAEKYVLPNVSSYIENLTLQETNKWGEKKGTSITFIEYLVQRAEAYMKEEVNFEGKSKAENNGFSWNGAQTRITYLIHTHLQYSISTAMKQALAAANSQIVDGIAETAKVQLAEISKKLKVEVKA